MQEIEIEYRPTKRITIIDCTQLSLTDLVERVQAMIELGQPTFLNWAEGIAFFYLPLSLDADVLVEKYLEGEAIIQNIAFALMPKYDRAIKVKHYDIRIVNQTPNNVLREVAKWLKKHANEDN